MPVQIGQTAAVLSPTPGQRRPPAIPPEVVEAVLARVPLRGDQQEAIRAYFAGIEDRLTVKVVELPAGTGKTRVGVAAAACLLRAGYTVLWVCKSRRLLRQAADTFVRYFPGYAARVEGPGRPRRPPPPPAGGLVLLTL